MGRQVTKAYNYNGLQGCVLQCKVRSTKTLVGVYHSIQAGMEDDPTAVWSTVCETHGNLVGHLSLGVAIDWVATPEVWCEDCQCLVK